LNGTPLVAYTQMLRHRERWMTPALEGLWAMARKYFGVAQAPAGEAIASIV